MAAATKIAPLSNSQKLFLQRLLVAHVLTHESALQLYASIKEGFAGVAPSDDEDEEDVDEGGNGRDEGYMGDDLGHCLGIINASLVPAFNLEVCTVSLPAPYDDDGEPPSQDGASPGRRRERLVRYHAVVNRSNDAAARTHAFPLSRGGPHDLAYFRLVLERLVERGAEALEEGGGGDAGVGCPGALSRMDLINLRTEMDGPHKDKLKIDETTRALDLLVSEGWLVQAAPPAEDDGDEADDGAEDDGDEEDDEEGGGRRSRHKRKKRPSSAGSRRKSLRGTFFGIGPRSFMELGDFLQKAGLPGDRMPQSILHRL